MQAIQIDLVIPTFLHAVSVEILDISIFLVLFIFMMMVGGLIFFSMHLTNKNKKFRPYIYGSTTFLGVFSFIIFIILMVDIVRGLINLEQPRNRYI